MSSDSSWSNRSNEDESITSPPQEKTKINKTHSSDKKEEKRLAQFINNNAIETIFSEVNSGSSCNSGSDGDLNSVDSPDNSPRKRSGYSSISSNTDNNSSENSSDDDGWCSGCNSSPCYFDMFKDDIMTAINTQFCRVVAENGIDFTYTDLHGNEVSNGIVRRSMYKYYVYYRHGHLGKGNRIKVEDCATKKIRDIFPEKDNKYLGFKAY